MTAVFVLATLTATSATQTLDGAAVGKRIDAIVQVVRNPEFDDELWESASLREMQEHPQRFRAGIEAYLRSNPEAPELNVRVAVLALQCLELREYLDFLDRSAAAEKGAISREALFYSVVPGVEWSTRLGRAYKDRRVRLTLKNVMSSPNADDRLRQAISGILAGEIARYAAREREHSALKCAR